MQPTPKSEDPLKKFRDNFSKDVIGRPISHSGYNKDTNYYFDSYSHFNIHEDMLKDTIRTRAYMNAIKKNPQLFQGKVVLDVGSGTGILSIFAAQAGAKHVYAVEKANIHLHSRKIIEENGLADRITVLNSKIEQVQLPVEQVDIIISEWMGYFLLYESMLDCVLYARDKWLKKDGLMFPDRAILYIALLEDQYYYNKKINYWDDVYGVSMKTMKKWVLTEPLMDTIAKSHVMSDEVKMLDIDLYEVKTEQLDFKSQFTLKVSKDRKILFGFITWFDCIFSHGIKKKTLSTSPFRSETHWRQTVFYLEKPMKTRLDDIVEGTIIVQKSEANFRQLDVLITFKFDEDNVEQFYRIT